MHTLLSPFDATLPSGRAARKAYHRPASSPVMLELADVLAARDRVAETARETPLEHSTTYSTWTGADVHLKLENFQRTGEIGRASYRERVLRLV